MNSQQGQVQPLTVYQPAFWQGIMAAMINIMILIAIGTWVFSQVKKAAKGEEIEKPF